MNSLNAYQQTPVIAPVKQSSQGSLKVVPANYLEVWSNETGFNQKQQLASKQNSQQKNITLSLVYIAIVALWFVLGSLLGSYFQTQSLFFWTGWTVVFGWTVGLLFFSAVSAYQLKAK